MLYVACEALFDAGWKSIRITRCLHPPAPLAGRMRAAHSGIARCSVNRGLPGSQGEALSHPDKPGLLRRFQR